MGVIAAMTELDQFTQFIVGDNCDPINDFMELIAPGKLDKCFKVTAKFDDGCWILWAAALVWVTAVQTVTRLAERAVKDRRGISVLLHHQEFQEADDAGFSDRCGFSVLHRMG